MQKISLTKQISTGFIFLVLIILVMGVISITNMSKAVDNSMRLDEQYLKEVEISSNIERAFASVRINVGKFIFTEDDSYKRAAEAEFKIVYKYINEAEELVKKYPNLVKLKEEIGPMEEKIKTYHRATIAISDSFDKKDLARKSLDKNANILMREIGKLVKSQQKQLKNDLRKGVKIDKRMRKIYMAYEITIKGYEVRIANFKSAARRNPKILEEGFKIFDDMDRVYKKILKLTRKEVDINSIKRVRQASHKYKQELINLRAAAKEVQKNAKVIVSSGDQALSAVQSVNNAGLKGTIKLSRSSMNSLHNSKELMTFGLVFAMIFALAIAYYIIVFGLKRPLTNFKDTILEIGENRDLTLKIDDNAPEELSQIAKSFNDFIHTLRDLIETTKKGASENASISNELSTTALAVGGNVEKSVSAIEEVSTKADGIQTELTDAIADAQNSKKEIIIANETLDDARKDINELALKVQQSAELEVELSERMQSLSQSANEVKSVLEIISDIADQTNLLALNAAIEAARAGEHGRGFAVVADEVRKLAERTQKSLVEINSTINVIVQSIMDVSGQMNSNSEEVQVLAEVSTKVEEKINSSVNIVSAAVEANDKTVDEFEKTGKNVDYIVEQVLEINKISSQNARNVEEIAAAADHLNSMTDDLHSKLEEFHT